MDKEHLTDLKEWLSADVIDDAEELLDEMPLIIELIDFWLDNN